MTGEMSPGEYNRLYLTLPCGGSSLGNPRAPCGVKGQHDPAAKLDRPAGGSEMLGCNLLADNFAV